jgi:hypothetical protein
VVLRLNRVYTSLIDLWDGEGGEVARHLGAGVPPVLPPKNALLDNGLQTPGGEVAP